MNIIGELKRLKLKTLRNRSGEGTAFFKDKIDLITKKSRKNVSSRPVIGKLYLAVYSAKHADTLPYYDRFPLFMPVSFSKEGNIIGINFHYLPIRLRQILMIEILKIQQSSASSKTKVKLTYQYLNGFSKFNIIKPTIHSYIHTHFRSKIMIIPEDDWLRAILLPIASFTGASKTQVYRDSKSKI